MIEDMEVEEIQAVLQKIWDLHDKLSDAIHSISRANFLDSVRSRINRKAKAGNFVNNNVIDNISAANGGGYVYFKDSSAGAGAEDPASLQEAKSLNAIRTALESLEDQLEFFHTVQMQQKAERDVAIARIEQSRMILAMRLSEHQGKKYEVIEEAETFVGLCNASRFGSQGNIYSPSAPHDEEKFAVKRSWGRNAIFNLLFSTFNFVKKGIKLTCISGIFGNTAMVAISMLVVVHLQQIGIKDRYIMELSQTKEDNVSSRKMTKVLRPEVSSSGGSSTSLDVLLARG